MRAILIAAKELAYAKTRLGDALPSMQRIELAEAMFRDVLAAAAASHAADHIAVISSDAGLLGLAKAGGAISINEEYPRGLNAAVRLATTALVAEGASQLCTLLSDVPLITGEDIDAAFAAAPARPGALIVPSRDRTGTNMIVRAPGDVIPTRFGRNSLKSHLAECARAGIRCEVLNLPRPAIDLDVLEDLREFVRVPSSTYTFNELLRLGLAQA